MPRGQERGIPEMAIEVILLCILVAASLGGVIGFTIGAKR